MKKRMKSILIFLIVMLLLATICYFTWPDPGGRQLKNYGYFHEDDFCFCCSSVLLLEIPISFFISFVKKRKAICANKQELEKNKSAHLDEIKSLNREIAKSLFFVVIISIICVWVFLFIRTIFFTVNGTIEAKPIIYLYPEQETKVSVVLGNSQNITCSYPKYIDGWNVVAQPNGDLIDLKTGRNLYALYWEGKGTSSKNDFEDGFCVKGEDTASFLEEKLAILGLNEREAEEFIVYWLPKLEANNYNLIRFQTMEEINSSMPLEITPKPDTTIRVMMEWRGISHYKELTEQKLVTPERVGFVAVEWGGTER